MPALSAAVVFVLTGFGSVDGRPVLIAPFAASVALIVAVPHVPLSRPRSIVLGYGFCTAAALAVVATGVSAIWSQSLAVGVGVLAMQLSNSIHPPAAAVPVLVSATDPGVAFLLSPVLLGAVLLAVLAAIHSSPTGCATQT